jgi:FRG domain-containing protein
MAKRAKPVLPPTVRGVQYVELGSWREFYPFINETLPDPQDHIFRGQRTSFWKLESSLDRALKDLGQTANAGRVATQHLGEFRLAIRGRRGLNPKELREKEQWALGQHYGLWTPLLDWTESPFVALYFAFEQPSRTGKGARAVFALSRSLVESKSLSIGQKQVDSAARPDIIEIITPMTDENARLVSQGGLFTRGTFGIDIERWVRTHFSSSASRALVKIIVPEKKGDRDEILRALNRMNINHRSLFPDISGSAHFCNMRLSVTGY